MSRRILGFCATSKRGQGARSDRKDKKTTEGEVWQALELISPTHAGGFHLSGIGVTEHSDSILNSSGLKFSHIWFSPSNFLCSKSELWVVPQPAATSPFLLCGATIVFFVAPSANSDDGDTSTDCEGENETRMRIPNDAKFKLDHVASEVFPARNNE